MNKPKYIAQIKIRGQYYMTKWYTIQPKINTTNITIAIWTIKYKE